MDNALAMSLMIVGPCVAVPGSALLLEHRVTAGGRALLPEARHGAGGDALLPELSMIYILIVPMVSGSFCCGPSRRQFAKPHRVAGVAEDPIVQRCRKSPSAALLKVRADDRQRTRDPTHCL